MGRPSYTLPGHGDSSVFGVPKWHLLLHREHRDLPLANDCDDPRLRLSKDHVEARTSPGFHTPPDGVATVTDAAVMRSW
jgi:hypothetical protein